MTTVTQTASRAAAVRAREGLTARSLGVPSCGPTSCGYSVRGSIRRLGRAFAQAGLALRISQTGRRCHVAAPPWVQEIGWPIGAWVPAELTLTEAQFVVGQQPLDGRRAADICLCRRQVLRTRLETSTNLPNVMFSVGQSASSRKPAGASFLRIELDTNQTYGCCGIRMIADRMSG
jgi:hypothetical protein